MLDAGQRFQPAGDKKIPLKSSIQRPALLNRVSPREIQQGQYPVSFHYLHHNKLKLDINFKILPYMDP